MASPPTSLLPYVIVGRGFSATVNCAMLLANPTSAVHSRKIVHIGQKDPWREYLPVDMGQWPLLLNLPAYSVQPRANQYELMNSRHFSSLNISQWMRQAWAVSRTIPSEVQSIAPIGNNYRLHFKDGASIDASYVDVCAGPGPSRPIPSSLNADHILKSSISPRPLLYAKDYLRQQTTRVRDGRVCVVGGGATGAWCVEVAQDHGNSVVWLSDKKLNEAFPSSRRNDLLVVPPVTRRIDQGNHIVDGDLVPFSYTTTFGECVTVSSLTLHSAKVTVGYTPLSGCSFTSRLGLPTSSLTDLDFDQVVWATGQATGLAEEGSWAKMLEPILSIARNNGTLLIRDRENKVVGLQSDTGNFRVLGASALAHPDVRREWETLDTESNLYFRSLPEQARVGLGITLAAVTIAEANSHWVGTVNPNLNTASLTDMKSLMASWPDQFNSAEAWFEARRTRIHPYAPSELAHLLTQQFTY